MLVVFFHGLRGREGGGGERNEETDDAGKQESVRGRKSSRES